MLARRALSILVGFTLAVGIVGCTQSSTDKYSTKESSTQQSDQPSVGSEGLNTEDVEYIQSMVSNGTELSGSIEQIGLLLSSEDLGSDAWVEAMYVETHKLQTAIDSAKSIKPTDGTKYIHDSYLKAMDEYEKFINELPIAIQEKDVLSIARAFEYLTIGTQYIKETTKLIEGTYWN